MLWEDLATEQIARIAGMSQADQISILQSSLVAFGKAVDRSNAAHMKYISDRLAELEKGK